MFQDQNLFVLHSASQHHHRHNKAFMTALSIWTDTCRPNRPLWLTLLLSSPLSSRWTTQDRKVSHPLLLLLCLGKQLADVGLRLSHVLVEDLRAVNHLRLTGVEHLANLPGHQGFSTPWWAKQQDSLHVLAAWSKKKHSKQKEKTGNRL